MTRSYCYSSRSPLCSYAAAVVIALNLLFGCRFFGDDDVPCAGVIMTFQAQTGESVTATELVTEIVRYRVRGFGPVGSSSWVLEEVFEASNDEKSLENLSAGMWRFDIEALNEDGQVIFFGTVEITPEANDVKSVTVVLLPEEESVEPGELLWSFAARSEFVFAAGLWSSPAIASDGTIYVGSCDSNVYAITAGGTEQWRFQTDSGVVSSPAIDTDGSVYVASRDGNLYALAGGSSGPAASPWSMFRHDTRRGGFSH